MDKSSAVYGALVYYKGVIQNYMQSWSEATSEFKKMKIQLSRSMSYFFQISSQGEWILLFLLAGIWIFLSSHLWNGDILFHTDLARDFLVLEDILKTQSPTLIGPRSGGIPGVFHGPLWYYISLPFFWLVNGNPVGMGWFWWALGIFSSAAFLMLAYMWTRHRVVSIFVTIGYTLLVLAQVASPVNNFGADLWSVFVFALWLHWYTKPKVILSIIGWLSLGLLVQFQMAWAVPIAVLWFPVYVFRSWQWRKKLFPHLLSSLLFLVPLASFVVFELRHDWLQVRSVVKYLQEPSLSGMSWDERLLDRATSAVTAGLNIFRSHNLLNLGILSVFFALGWKSRKDDARFALGLLAYLYFGWWALTLAFSGTLWGYYFSPFIGIIFFVVALIAKEKKYLVGLLGFATALIIVSSQSQLMYSAERFDGSSWRLLSHIAEESLTEGPVGYFVYSQDQFAYPLKYAFSYYARQNPEKDIIAYSKRDRTVLVKAADDPRNPYLTAESWQLNSLRISQEPDSIMTYPYGYRLEVYFLDQKAQEIPIDDNLLLDLHFR